MKFFEAFNFRETCKSNYWKNDLTKWISLFLYSNNIDTCIIFLTNIFKWEIWDWYYLFMF
jgi:hypothetical protein